MDLHLHYNWSQFQQYHWGITVNKALLEKADLVRRGSTQYSETGDGEDNALPILSDLSFSYMHASSSPIERLFIWQDNI